MAAIDTLLGIVQMKKADGLVLAGGDVPALLVGGTRSPLTMPPLAPAMLDIFFEELLTAEQRAALARGEELEGAYATSTLGAFVVRARLVDGKARLVLKRGSTRAGAARDEASGAAARSIDAAVPGEGALPTAPTPAASPRPPQEPPAVAAAFAQALARGASDLILSAGARAVLRVDGELVELRGDAITSDELERVFSPLLDDERRRALSRAGSVDLAYTRRAEAHGGATARFRVNLFRQHRGLAAAVRPIRDEVPALEALGLPPSLLAVTAPRHGLVLMTGATGAGKSTTLAALVEQINRTRALHVVTLEDPIEYVYPRRRALVHQREIGTDVESFAVGLRAALRESPDVILVGELRDAETIRMALTAAETGHLVLATLHSGSPIMAIERLVDVFGDGEKDDVRQQVASALRYVVTQQLVRTSTGERVPVLEVLAVNAAVAAQIRDGRTHMLATQMELGADEGMVSMERALFELVRAGRIGREAALAAAARREALEALLSGGRR